MICLYGLLTDGPFRERCLRKIKDPLILQSFGTYERTKGSVKDAESTLRRAFLISFHQVSRLTLGQPDLGLDFRRMMDRGTCLIVNLGNIQDSETRRRDRRSRRLHTATRAQEWRIPIVS